MQPSGMPILRHMHTRPGAMPFEGFSYKQPEDCLIIISASAARIDIHGRSHSLAGCGCIMLPAYTVLHVQLLAAGGKRHEEATELRFYACAYEWVDAEDANPQPVVPKLARLDEPELLTRAAELYEGSMHQLYSGVSQRLALQASFLALFADAWWVLEQPHAVGFERLNNGVDRVVAHLKRNYNRRIDREEAAALAGLSVRQFTSSFKKRTGCTLVEYLNRLRIDQAKTMVLQSQQRQPLNEIARQVGYADEFYLSRKFKQVEGISPTMYVSKPKRIASLDHAYTLDLLSLGITPCAAITDSWINERFRLLSPPGSFRPLYWQMQQAERLRVLEAARPDLILHPLMDPDEEHLLEPYRSIGLVLQIPWRELDWRQHFLGVADLTNAQSQAQSWLEQFDARTEQAREVLRMHLPSHETVAIINVRSDRLLIYARGYMGADLLYETLQLQPPAGVEALRKQGQEHPELTTQQLPLYDADHYFLSIESSPQARRRASILMQSREWRERQAVKQQHAYLVEMAQWYGYGPAALEAQLDDILAALAPIRPNKQGSN